MFVYWGVTVLYDSKQNETAVFANLQSSGALLQSVVTPGRSRAVASVLAGLGIVASMLLLLDAKGKGCALGVTLLLHSWLVEGLFTAPSLSVPVLINLLKNTSMLGAILVF